MPETTSSSDDPVFKIYVRPGTPPPADPVPRSSSAPVSLATERDAVGASKTSELTSEVSTEERQTTPEVPATTSTATAETIPGDPTTPDDSARNLSDRPDAADKDALGAEDSDASTEPPPSAPGSKPTFKQTTLSELAAETTTETRADATPPLTFAAPTLPLDETTVQASLTKALPGTLTTTALTGPTKPTGTTSSPGHSLALDGNILALGFVLMTIVIVIVVWAYCVRRTKPSEQDLHAALVDDDEGNSPGYIAVGMTHAHDRPGTYVNDTYAGTEMLPMNAHAEKPRTEESHMGTITPAPWGDRWDAPAEPSFYDSATSAGADGLNAENAATGDLSNAMAGLGGETES